MKFVFPCKTYEQKALAFIREFHECGSEINGTGGLDGYLEAHTYAEWLETVQKGIDIANVPEGKVPALTYFYVREDDGCLVGMINIRLALNDFLRTQGGHIGYSIRPTERQKGYGTNMLREALAFCRNIGMSDFILTCNKENHASAGVIRNCGGVLEAELYSEAFGEELERYRIE